PEPRLNVIDPIHPNAEPTMMRRVQAPLLRLAAALALAVLFSVTPALAADMDAKAKALARVDNDWSKAAATRDADRVASFYAEDAIAIRRINLWPSAGPPPRRSGPGTAPTGPSRAP